MKADLFIPFLLLFFMQLSVAGLSQSISQPVELRCEYKTNPAGIDTKHPRLSWLLKTDESKRGIKQSAYQVQVATDKDCLKKGKKLLWDSGKQSSDRSVNIAVPELSLNSRGQYYWRVKVWDERDKKKPVERNSLLGNGLT